MTSGSAHPDDPHWGSAAGVRTAARDRQAVRRQRLIGFLSRGNL